MVQKDTQRPPRSPPGQQKKIILIAKMYSAGPGVIRGGQVAILPQFLAFRGFKTVARTPMLGETGREWSTPGDRSAGQRAGSPVIIKTDMWDECGAPEGTEPQETGVPDDGPAPWSPSRETCGARQGESGAPQGTGVPGNMLAPRSSSRQTCGASVGRPRGLRCRATGRHLCVHPEDTWTLMDT